MFYLFTVCLFVVCFLFGFVFCVGFLFCRCLGHEVRFGVWGFVFVGLVYCISCWFMLISPFFVLFTMRWGVFVFLCFRVGCGLGSWGVGCF